ncbi:MAG: ATPase/DNA packaging protein [Flavobacteriales bacterium]
MNPENIPFNALIVGPTNSGKSLFLLNQLWGPFRGKFDYIVFVCPTFDQNETYQDFATKDPWFWPVVCEQHQIEYALSVLRNVFRGLNTLIVLDDCASSKDVKGRTGELVNLAFSARHSEISVWVLTQKLTSITSSFRENVAAIVLFYTPSFRTLKAVFDDYGSDISAEEQQKIITTLKNNRYSHLIISLRFPFIFKIIFSVIWKPQNLR